MKPKPARSYETASLNTKKMFARSLKKLLQQMPLEKISIQKLSEDCGVNRKTFYYHFENMGELLDWMLEDDAKEAFREMERSEDPEQLMRYIMDYCDKNRKMLKMAFQDAGASIRRMKLYSHREVRLILEQAERECGRTLPGEYRNYVMEFYCGALAEQMDQYIYRPALQAEREKILRYTLQTMRSAIRAALRTE